MPAIFTIELVNKKKNSIKRNILNIEKIEISTNHKGIIKNCDEVCFIKVHAEREGVSFDSEIEKEEIYFNISIDKLYMGKFTFETLKLFGIILIILILLIRFVSKNYDFINKI
jgi:hypothetical protein